MGEPAPDPGRGRTTGLDDLSDPQASADVLPTAHF